MTFVVVERALVTTAIYNALSTLGFPVGDNSSPVGTNFGWQGQPDATNSTFEPWISLTPLMGSGTGMDMSSLAQRAEWALSYSVFVAGVNREQSEKLADRCRQVLGNMVNQTVSGGQAGNWIIQGIACVNLGSNMRVGDAIPYYYTQTDTYQAFVTKG